MEIKEIVRKIFGPNVVLGTTNVKSTKESSKHSRIANSLQAVNQYMDTLLLESVPMENEPDNRVGRIGPNLVKFDTSSHYGLFSVSPDRLSINSENKLSTIRANVAVYKGKWMYELQLGSKGLMQVGWSTAKCKFNQQQGVGDTINSYAYDGYCIRKWNVVSHKYGEPWFRGDIVGCAIDMDNGTIDFYRSGRHLGQAFENISMGAGFAYFPTVSLALTENLTANFGSTPMRYPVEGYEPLQAAPKEQIAQATLLFNWFSRIIEVVNTRSDIDDQSTLRDGNMSVQAYLMCLSRSVLKHIGPLLTVPYITEYILIPFLQQLSDSKTEPPLLLTCLDLMWAFLEEHEIKASFESIILYLLSTFRIVSLLPEYSDQCKSLLLLIKICQHSLTRQYLLQYLLFDRGRFANFMLVKPLDEGGLADVVSNVWWEMTPIDPTIEINKASYFDACEKIRIAISKVESLQIDLLVTLLDNSDGSEKKPTSRTIFLRKFKLFVQGNLESSRILPNPLCWFHQLLAAFKVLWNAEVGTSPVYVPCRVFYDASIDYSIIERLGGVLSHLNKTFKNDLLQRLGAEHEVITTMDQAQDSSNVHNRTTRLADFPIVVPALGITIGYASSSSQMNPMVLERLGYSPYTREDRTPLRLGALDPTISLLELLDSIILFYHVAAKKQLVKVVIVRNNMSEYITAIQEAKGHLEKAKSVQDPESESIQQELLRTINVFNTKLTELARYMAWIRAAIYSKEKQLQLAWLLKVVTLTLRNASAEGNMFSFVPDFYLDTLTDLCVGLRNHMHPTAPIEQIPDYREMFLSIAEFLCQHFMDPRIVNANSKSALLLTLAGFMFNPLTLHILENVAEESRIKVVTNLLKSYDNRAWAESNWILVRFWQGNGFAFRYDKSPHLSKRIEPRILNPKSVSQSISQKPCPSVVYQNHVRDVLLKSRQDTTKLLNSLLNQLNCTFSGFIEMVQEIHNVSARPERVFIESRQFKVCATYFGLAVSLLRVIEMITTVAPSIFNNPSQFSSENLLFRLCQLLCQVLNRMSLQTNFLQHVLLEIPDLESVDHFPILAAVVGILLALLSEDMSKFKSKSLTEVPKVTQALLMEPNFQMSSLYFVLGDTKLKNKTERNIKPFSFCNYPNDVTKEEIEKIKEMIDYLDECRAILPDLKILSDDDNTCTICYAYPVAVIFEPCYHQTCRICIDRHLLNTRECFFCTVIIDKVVDLSDNVLYDFSKNVTSSMEVEESS